MKRIYVWILAAAMASSVFAAMHLASRSANAEGSSPIFGVTIPDGYRQWELIAPSHQTGSFNELRAILGNTLSMTAYRRGTLPFPDGAILVKLAWKRVPSNEFKGAFVPGAATTVQIMVKDSKKYAATGGWGFGRFIDGKPVDEPQHKTCFGCHEANVKNHDFVFTRFAP
jgi:Cytochrome P460